MIKSEVVIFALSTERINYFSDLYMSFSEIFVLLPLSLIKKLVRG